MVSLFRQFGNDPETIAILALIGVDLLFGVSAALYSKTQQFNFAYVADFLRSDVLAKLVPYAGLWILFHVSGDFNLGDLEVLETGVSTVIIAALAASILKSLGDLGVPVPAVLGQADPVTPA